MNNRDLYNQEREKRWTMAKDKEPEAIAAICNILSSVSGCNIEYSRYDEIWFKKFDPSIPENEWVRGASDYVIEIEKKRYVYAEIKIKSVKFKKTVTGGKTKKGSEITNYGCESFYLDIVPVYQNMCLFVNKVHIDSDKFIIFFINEEMSEVHAISLKELQELIKSGYNSKPICIFSEGYGTNTKYGAAPNYLIPINCTHKVDENFIQYMHTHSMNRLITDIDDSIYAHKYGFYHQERECKFIRNKPQSEIEVFTCKETAEKAGYIPCKECCK